MIKLFIFKKSVYFNIAHFYDFTCILKKLFRLYKNIRQPI